MDCMSVTLDVSKLSGWLNADVDCRVDRKADMQGAAMCSPGGVRALGGGVRALGGGDAVGMHTGRVRLKAVGQGTREAHPEHAGHGRDAGRVPIRYVRVENPHVIEERAHVGDGRDNPVGDQAVLCNSGSRVEVVRRDRRLQGGLGREGV